MRGSNLSSAVNAPKAEEPFHSQAFADLYGGVTRYRTTSGNVIYRQEESADCLYYLEQGRLVLKVGSPHGKDAIIGVLDAGDFFGEECLTSRTLRSATAICLSDSLAVRIEKASVVRAIRHDPAFATLYLRRVVNHGDALKASLISQLTDGSEQRLARILLQLAARGDQATAASIAGFDQEALAQMVGTTRSRVNYFMNRFRELGYIDYNDTIAIQESLWRVVLGEDSSGSGANIAGSNDDDQ